MITISEDPALLAQRHPENALAKRIGKLAVIVGAIVFICSRALELSGAPLVIIGAIAVICTFVIGPTVLRAIDRVDAEYDPQSLVFDGDAVHWYSGPVERTIPWDAIKTWALEPDGAVRGAQRLTLHMAWGAAVEAAFLDKDNAFPAQVSLLLSSPNDFALAREALKDV